ncbi:MAG: hypothetical protein FWD58_08830 [Firmicutes bacterium]|nr:hypothetical protein [Bacillota bacterium]
MSKRPKPEEWAGWREKRAQGADALTNREIALLVDAVEARRMVLRVEKGQTAKQLSKTSMAKLREEMLKNLDSQDDIFYELAAKLRNIMKANGG